MTANPNMSVDAARPLSPSISSSTLKETTPTSALLTSNPPQDHEPQRYTIIAPNSSNPSLLMAAESAPRKHYPPEPLYNAAGAPLPQGIPTEGPATHPDGPPRDYSYAQSAHPVHYLPSHATANLPPSSTMQADERSSPKQEPQTPNPTELLIRSQMSNPPSPTSDMTQGGAGANHYPSSSGVPRLPPILQVEKQQVTTSATQLASASRRRNEAHFVCPVPGCGSTFTRRFNLRGHLRSHTEERPYVCEWPGCKKGFARQHDCKRHQALHTAKSQANVCQGCKKTFSRLDALNRHLRSDGGAECRSSNPKFANEQQENRSDQGSTREHNLQ